MFFFLKVARPPGANLFSPTARVPFGGVCGGVGGGTCVCVCGCVGGLVGGVPLLWAVCGLTILPDKLKTF